MAAREDASSARGRVTKRKTKTPGKNIKQDDFQYNTSIGMMIGIRVSLRRQQFVHLRTPTDSDFGKVDTTEFPPAGTGPEVTDPLRITPAHSLEDLFSFKDYAPKVFKALRTSWGIDREQFMSSVCGRHNYLEFTTNSKSGQFFFFSHDGKYLIKSVSIPERRFLSKILPAYYRHMINNKHSRVCRFCGLHRVEFPNKQKMRFVIMESVFDVAMADRVYDLKGSTAGRISTPANRLKRGYVMKDQDIQELGDVLNLGPARKKAFLEQLGKDAKLMDELNIMDYSLLLGIEEREAVRVVASDGNGYVYRYADLSAGDDETEADNTHAGGADVRDGSGRGWFGDVMESIFGATPPSSQRSDVPALRLTYSETLAELDREYAADEDGGGEGGGTDGDFAAERKAHERRATAEGYSCLSYDFMQSFEDQERSVGVDAVEEGGEQDVGVPGDKDFFGGSLQWLFEASKRDKDAEGREGEGEEKKDEQGGEDGDAEANGILAASQQHELETRGAAAASPHMSHETRLRLYSDEPSLGRLSMRSQALHHLHEWEAQSAEARKLMTQARRSTSAEARRCEEVRADLFLTDPIGGEEGMTASGAARGRIENGKYELYYFGIIDILQVYTHKKRLEHHAKGVYVDKTTISACPPDMYAARFIAFMDSISK